jgi:hypothetical protein
MFATAKSVFVIYTLSIAIVIARVRGTKDDASSSTCKNTGSMAKRESLTFCDEYRTLTCCNSQVTDTMLVHHVEMQRSKTSAKCAALWSRFECSKCDHRNEGNGIVDDSARFKVCFSYAKQLFEACREEYFMESGTKIAPCKSTDAICAKLEEYSVDVIEAVELMGAEVIKSKHNGVTSEAFVDDEDVYDFDFNAENEEEDSATNVVEGKSNAWCFDGSLPKKIATTIDRKASSSTKDKKNANTTTKALFKNKYFRKYRKFFTVRWWQRDHRVAKAVMFFIYPLVLITVMYRKYATKIKVFLWKRRSSKMRENAFNAAQTRMKVA